MLNKMYLNASNYVLSLNMNLFLELPEYLAYFTNHIVILNK